MLFPHGKILMCKPNFFDVKYEINAWMDIEKRPEVDLAERQWHNLHHTLIRLGAYLEYIMPDDKCPDLVFTANAGLVKGEKVVLAEFLHAERQVEQPIDKAWFEHYGLTVHEPTTGHFEGEGDALFVGDLLVCGYGLRSDKSVYPEVAKELGVDDYLTVELNNEYFYHLDTCFCPVSETQALYYPGAFTEESIARMKERIELLPVCEEDARQFACNAVVLGDSIILPERCDETEKTVRGVGLTPHGVALGQFLLGGGSAKCLTLHLDRKSRGLVDLNVRKEMS